MATSNSNASDEPKKAKTNKIASVGKMALKQNDTAKEAADYVNSGSWGFRASAKDNKIDAGPNGWTGQAKDRRWLILEADRDSTPK